MSRAARRASRTRAHRLAPVAVLVVAVLGTLLGPLPRSSGAPQLAPQMGTLLGAYVQASGGWSQAELKADITGLETYLGRKLDIDQHYYPWAKTFPTWQETWDLASGRTPLISWGGTSTVEINSGVHDDLIRARADAVKALGKPVFLRWFYEMDTSKLSANAGPPAEYIAAWRRIHGIFRERGATNVAWVWCPTSGAFHSGEAQTYYPGDAYVDWVAADGYNWAPTKPGSTWRTTETIFRAFYDWGVKTGKPLMIAETGTGEGSAGQKAAWFRDAAVTLRTKFPAVKAYVYFDSKTTDFDGTIHDWRVDSTIESYQAFRELANDPHLNPTTLTSVTLATAGDGSGSVTSDPAGIDCGLTCSGLFSKGTSVTLTATPSASSTFQGWTGPCGGTSRTCSFAPTGPTSVTVSFAVKRHDVMVEPVGTGGGTVVGQGIQCPGDCREQVVHGTSVRLVAAPDAGSAFAGWSGPCAGSGLECVVTALAPTSVGVIFDRIPQGAEALTLIRSGSQGGSVTANPGQGACAMTCVLSYAEGEVVDVTAAPDAGSSFVGWSGDCAGTTPACSVVMDQSRIVEAGFAPISEVRQPEVDATSTGSKRRPAVLLSVVNGGNVADSYVLEGTRGTRRVPVRYLADGADVTSTALDGTLVISHVAAGDATDLLLLARRTRKVRAKRSRVEVTISSMEHPAATVTANLTLRLPRRR